MTSSGPITLGAAGVCHLMQERPEKYLSQRGRRRGRQLRPLHQAHDRKIQGRGRGEQGGEAEGGFGRGRLEAADDLSWIGRRCLLRRLFGGAVHEAGEERLAAESAPGPPATRFDQAASHRSPSSMTGTAAPSWSTGVVPVKNSSSRRTCSVLLAAPAAPTRTVTERRPGKPQFGHNRCGRGSGNDRQRPGHRPPLQRHTHRAVPPRPAEQSETTSTIRRPLGFAPAPVGAPCDTALLWLARNRNGSAVLGVHPPHPHVTEATQVGQHRHQLRHGLGRHRHRG